METNKVVDQETVALQQRIAKLEQRLQEQTAELQIFKELIEHETDCIGVLDLDGTLTYANPAFCAYHRVQRVNGSGGGNGVKGIKGIKGIPGGPSSASAIDSVTPGDQEQHARIIEEVLAKGSWHGVVTYHCTNGKQFKGLETDFAICDEDGQPRAVGRIVHPLPEQPPKVPDQAVYAELAMLRQRVVALGQELDDVCQREHTLRTTEERLRYVLEGSNDGAWDWNIATNEAYLSPRYKAMIGYQSDELPDTPESWMNQIHPEDTPKVQQALQDYLEGRAASYGVEHRLQHRSGEWVWMLSRGKVVTRDEEGRPTRMTGTITDITERKQFEQKLRTFHTIIENAPDGIGFARLDGTITYANQSYCAMSGFGDELPGKNLVDAYDEPPEHLASLVQQVVEQGSWQGILTYRRKDGSTFKGQLSAFNVLDAQGQPQAVGGIFRDITEWLELEAQLQRANTDLEQRIAERTADLRESEEKFRTMLDYTYDWEYWRGPDGTFHYMSPSCERITGYRADEFLDDADLLVRITHPEDRPLLLQHIQDVASSTEACFLDFRIVTRSGEERWVSQISHPLYNAEGRRIGARASNRDITEQHQKGEQLRLFQSLVENSTDFIGVATPEGQPIYVNEAGQRLVGLDGEEAVLRSEVLKYFVPEERDKVLKEVLPTVMEQGHWEGELRFQHFKTGASIPVNYNLFTIKDYQHGKVTAMATVTRDLIAQKQAEAEQIALREQVIEAQQAAIRELSTPLIPIANNVVAMPLIGSIDSARAQDVMETLLEGIAHHRANAAILDITGVRVVDTQVADTLIRAAQAVKLLGAQVIITGIRPDVAQTLVHLGTDLRGIITLGSFQAGITYALRQGGTAEHPR